MLKLVLLLVTLAMLSALQERLHSGMRDREQAAQAMAGRLQMVAEAAQRYAVDTNALRSGATTASLTVEELILASYLPEGSSLFGPFGGPIRLTARTGAHGHVAVDVELDLPEESSVDLRKAMSDLDAGGGQVSLQAGEGATRFIMPRDNRQTLRLSGSVKMCIRDSSRSVGANPAIGARSSYIGNRKAWRINNSRRQQKPRPTWSQHYGFIERKGRKTRCKCFGSASKPGTLGNGSHLNLDDWSFSLGNEAPSYTPCH